MKEEPFPSLIEVCSDNMHGQGFSQAPTPNRDLDLESRSAWPGFLYSAASLEILAHVRCRILNPGTHVVPGALEPWHMWCLILKPGTRVVPHALERELNGHKSYVVVKARSCKAKKCECAGGMIIYMKN